MWRVVRVIVFSSDKEVWCSLLVNGWQFAVNVFGRHSFDSARVVSFVFCTYKLQTELYFSRTKSLYTGKLATVYSAWLSSSLLLLSYLFCLFLEQFGYKKARVYLLVVTGICLVESCHVTATLCAAYVNKMTHNNDLLWNFVFIAESLQIIVFNFTCFVWCLCFLTLGDLDCMNKMEPDYGT